MPKKHRVNVESLFTAHASVSAFLGLVAFVFPHLFEFFLLPHGEKLALRNNAVPGDRVEHLLVRMYGALVLGQAYVAWSARTNTDATFRRSLVHAFAGVFTLTFLALLRAQLAPDGPLSSWNYLNILTFASLAVAYGYYSLVEPIRVFEGIGKGVL
jgi:hypothetical protein